MMSGADKKIHERSLTEIVVGLVKMHEYAVFTGAHTGRAYHEEVVRSIGSDYKLYLGELRNRGYVEMADQHERKAKEWLSKLDGVVYKSI